MKPTQTEYVIGYDNFTGYLLCTIDRKVVSVESLAELLTYIAELLTYIAELYDHTPNLVYSEMEYMDVLERNLGITFRFGK